MYAFRDPLRKLLRVFFFKLPQNRHPERSASQMDRVTQRLGRGAEGTSGAFNCPMLPGAFQPPGPVRFFPGAEHQELASILLCPASTSSFARPIPNSKMTTVL